MPPPHGNTVLKRFCATINNYTDEDDSRARNFAESACQYAIIGREIAPTTGTPHLQCFFNMLRGQRFNRIKTILGPRVHIEASKGTDLDNQKYCSKGNNFQEFGNIQKQGKRNDLLSIAEAIKKGSGLVELCENFTTSFIRYHSGIEKTYRYIGRGSNERNWKSEVSTPQTSWGASNNIFYI